MSKVELNLNPEHAITAFWITWEALGVALAAFGQTQPNDNWKEPLRQKMLEPFLHGKLSESEEGLGVMHPEISKHLKNFEMAAIQDGIKAVDAALSRIQYL